MSKRSGDALAWHQTPRDSTRLRLTEAVEWRELFARSFPHPGVARPPLQSLGAVDAADSADSSRRGPDVHPAVDFALPVARGNLPARAAVTSPALLSTGVAARRVPPRVALTPDVLPPAVAAKDATWPVSATPDVPPPAVASKDATLSVSATPDVPPLAAAAEDVPPLVSPSPVVAVTGKPPPVSSTADVPPPAVAATDVTLPVSPTPDVPPPVVAAKYVAQPVSPSFVVSPRVTAVVLPTAPPSRSLVYMDMASMERLSAGFLRLFPSSNKVFGFRRGKMLRVVRCGCFDRASFARCMSELFIPPVGVADDVFLCGHRRNVVEDSYAFWDAEWALGKVCHEHPHDMLPNDVVVQSHAVFL